jgi:hypothetical protein
MEKIYSVLQDGFEMCDQCSIEDARKVLEIYRHTDAYYQLAIYRHNQDGTLSYIEGV